MRARIAKKIGKLAENVGERMHDFLGCGVRHARKSNG
jgi:hypothetical protein